VTYPDDIMEAARAVYDQLGRGSVADERTIAEALQGQRFAATYAERKRCAAVAEGHYDDDGTGLECQGCGEVIAARIRKGEA
jgi:hypothetical protein